MTPKSLRAKISKLRVAAPVTESYDRALVALGLSGGGEGVWYRSQKEHWMGWLAEYDGPGAYGVTAPDLPVRQKPVKPPPRKDFAFPEVKIGV